MRAIITTLIYAIFVIAILYIVCLIVLSLPIFVTILIVFLGLCYIPFEIYETIKNIKKNKK